VYPNTLGCLTGGNYLKTATFCTLDLKSGKKDHIWSSRNGFQTFAANYKRGLIVLAEQGLNPSIFIYQFPNKKPIATIQSKI